MHVCVNLFRIFNLSKAEINMLLGIHTHTHECEHTAEAINLKKKVVCQKVLPLLYSFTLTTIVKAILRAVGIFSY